MRIAFFGSSLVSAYWNGAATYYRGILKALHARGHSIVFYEPDAYERQQHRDIEPPPYARVVVYKPTPEALEACLAEASAWANLVVKASGVGVLDAELEAGVLRHRRDGQMIAFWDVDAPATLATAESDAGAAFRNLVPQYDLVLTYGGGQPVVDRYTALGARLCVPVYNALDPDTHFPVAAESRFYGDLAFLGNRLPDREARVEEFFLRPAASLPDRRFLLGGNGWQDKALPANVRLLGHVYTQDHNALNCTPLAVLNIARDSMASNGWSPATRVFEAAGAGACLITDAWEGLSDFFTPDEEVLVAEDGRAVVRILQTLTPERAQGIGEAALTRVRRDHTYTQRATVVMQAIAEAKRGLIKRVAVAS